MKASSVEHLRLSSQEEGDEDSDRDRDDNSAQMQKMGLKNTTYTIKDNHDTIRSNQTTVNMMIEEMNKVRELPSIRYIFSFEPEEVGRSTLSDEPVTTLLTGRRIADGWIEAVQITALNILNR